MTYAIAAAGTGGHVFPGLAVGEALVAAGVPRDEVLFVGGSRLESTVYPARGYPFLQVELQGLERSLTPRNLRIPAVVYRAMQTMASEFESRGVGAVLGLGGYVTIPAAFAARRVGAALVVSEQNAEAGLANAVAARLARRRFGAFPETGRLPGAEWVGNPIREELARFDRSALRPIAMDRYGLDPALPVLGVFGGSLGAGAINDAVRQMMSEWSGPQMQVLHLAGTIHAEAIEADADESGLVWRVVGFEDQMELFYAASDLIVARAGGGIAELAVTATPAILVPGAFGSGRHQEENAAVFALHGAAEVLPQDRLGELAPLVAGLVADEDRLADMARALGSLSKPHAATTIAAALREAHG